MEVTSYTSRCIALSARKIECHDQSVSMERGLEDKPSALVGLCDAWLLWDYDCCQEVSVGIRNLDWSFGWDCL